MVNALFGVRGRTSRLPYLLLLVLNQMLASVIVIVAFMMAWAGPREVGLTRETENVALGVMLGLLALTGWVYVAISVKRLHDLDRSGWHLAWITGLAVAVGPLARAMPGMPGMVVAIASLGGVMWLVLAPGTPGPNRFGPEPGTAPRGSVPSVGSAR